MILFSKTERVAKVVAVVCAAIVTVFLGYRYYAAHYNFWLSLIGLFFIGVLSWAVVFFAWGMVVTILELILEATNKRRRPQPKSNNSDGNDSHDQRSLAVELVESRRFNEALKILDELILKDGDQKDKLARGVVLVEMDFPLDALDDLETVTKDKLITPIFHSYIGMAYFKVGNWTKAVNHLKLGDQNSFANYGALINMAETVSLSQSAEMVTAAKIKNVQRRTLDGDVDHQNESQ